MNWICSATSRSSKAAKSQAQCDLISGGIEEVERNQSAQTLPVFRFDHHVGDVSGHRIDHHAPHLAAWTVGARGGGADSYDLVIAVRRLVL